LQREDLHATILAIGQSRQLRSPIFLHELPMFPNKTPSVHPSITPKLPSV
jgi:hypothetical protein